MRRYIAEVIRDPIPNSICCVADSPVVSFL